jgi:serine/threonine protein kinase
MAKLIQLSGACPADEGEALVVNHLKDQLPDTYTLIPNTEIIERGRPAFEYDLIVVAPHAVYVIEVKRWRGGIQGDDHTWVVAGQHRRPNPWPTANNKARVLKSQIQRRQPACDPLWVEAVVAIADDQGGLDLRGHCRERVLRYTDLPAFLTDASALGGKANDLRPMRAYIEKTIQEAARGRTAGPVHFGDYVVLENLSRRDRVAEYLARNVLLRGAEPVRLRVFSYDPYLEADDLARRQEVIRREAESLQKIGPHPNLIALQGFATDPEDPNLFVEVTDWSEEGTLRVLMSAESALSLERKLELAQGIAAGLKAAHDADVIHRDVRPENVLIGRDGLPRLMNFDHARLALPDARTVSPVQRDPDVPHAYMAPELLDPTCRPTPAADLYGLGMILFEILTGSTLYDKPEDALDQPTTLGGPAEYAPDIPERLNALVRRMIHADPKRRPQSANEVLEELKAIREKPSGTGVEAVQAVEPEPIVEPAQEIEPAVFEVSHLIDGKYQVQKVLEAGASGRVYQVYDSIFDQVYALKVFNDTSLSLDFLKKEARSLRAVSHPNIVRVHNWGRLAQTGRLYLVTDFVEGEELGKYTTPDRRLPVREAVDAVLDLLSALETLHPDVDRLEGLRAKMEEGAVTEEEYEEFGRLQDEGWLHRDVKPANLMLSPGGLMLVDFNIAAKASEASRTRVGTPGYMLPEVGIMPWDTDGDLFATGVVLYELITGHHPYRDREPNVEEPPTDPRQCVPELRPELAELVLRAVSCDPNRRYHSARRFRRDLLDLEGVYLQVVGVSPPVEGLALEPWEQGKLNYNPYVTRFLTLYSQARRDNSGTRGLDDVARLTYVDTRLDRLLRPAVLDGQYRLAIITGNAGDGKTAFIQNLEAVVREEGGHVETLTSNSSTFVYRGARFVTNYDGSQDEGAERANDQVLTEFFTPFDDAHLEEAFGGRPAEVPSVHVIAINEGRLIDFFRGPVGQSRFQGLAQVIDRFFDADAGQEDLPEWMLIVDLNRRSVVASDPDVEGASVFERQLVAFLRPEFWAHCQACAHRDQCFIKFNVDTLADPVSGPMVRERLRALFEIVHLRRQLHITMRDMRSALSWLLFRDHTCDDVAQMLETRPPPKERLALLYHNAYAADGRPPEGRSDDRLVRLLRQIDPAQMANPAADRFLHFQGLSGVPMWTFDARSPLAAQWLQEWRLPGGWEAARQAHVAADHRARHAIARRIAFFERRDESWMHMLPYQNLALFRQVTQSATADLDELKQMLVYGISTAEGARHSLLARQFVCLRAGQQAKANIKSFRLFPITGFDIAVPLAESGHYLEYTPDRILFYHDPQDADQRIEGTRRAELVVSLDLLELLAQIREGFVPSPDDIGGFFINLVMFKNGLAHLPYRRVLLTRDDAHFYELALRENSVITLQPWSTEGITADEAES